MTESIRDNSQYNVNTSITSNGRQPMLHSLLYAMYPIYGLMPKSEQCLLMSQCMETLAYALDFERFYEKYKLAHFAKKSELQNKFIQYEDLSTDKAMQKVFVNYFNINIVILSPYGEDPVLIPTNHHYNFKGCVVLEKRQNKYFPYECMDKRHNYILPNQFDELTIAMKTYTKRQKYKLRPFYTYKINDLLEIAKQFHIITQKPGRYNRIVNKSKRELYDELSEIL